MGKKYVQVKLGKVNDDCDDACSKCVFKDIPCHGVDCGDDMHYVRIAGAELVKRKKDAPNTEYVYSVPPGFTVVSNEALNELCLSSRIAESALVTLWDQFSESEKAWKAGDRYWAEADNDNFQAVRAALAYFQRETLNPGKIAYFAPLTPIKYEHTCQCETQCEDCTCDRTADMCDCERAGDGKCEGEDVCNYCCTRDTK